MTLRLSTLKDVSSFQTTESFGQDQGKSVQASYDKEEENEVHEEGETCEGGGDGV